MKRHNNEKNKHKGGKKISKKDRKIATAKKVEKKKGDEKKKVIKREVELELVENKELLAKEKEPKLPIVLQGNLFAGEVKEMTVTVEKGVRAEEKELLVNEELEIAKEVVDYDSTDLDNLDLSAIVQNARIGIDELRVMKEEIIDEREEWELIKEKTEWLN